MIETSAARRIECADIPALAISRRFGNYKPESEKAVRKTGVVEDETRKRLMKAWKACSSTGNSETDYAKMLRKVKRLEYSAKDVESFSLALVEFQKEYEFSFKAGLFLSALINNCKDSEFVIHTSHLDESIDDLGYENIKDIIVEGDVGVGFGTGMKGGIIMVKGNAGALLGTDMEGGSITLKGNAGKWLANDMKGGEIHLYGDIERIHGEVKHGKIFYNGKLIVDE
jgi:hypothetical protein